MRPRRPSPALPTGHGAARALTAVVLIGFTVAVYVVVVVGGGALTSRDEGGPRLVLSVLATCLVAVALEPVRAAVLPWARRLLDHGQSTPYEALSRFCAQAAGAYALDEVLPQTAAVLADATGARSAEVWLTGGVGPQRAACWPADAAPSRLLRDDGEGLRAEPAADTVVEVRHAGALLGALVVRQAPDDPLTPVERALVADLASSAGLVLRNIALSAERAEQVARIEARSRELAASRTRLVAAQDAERRRLERDIHDGAQQHLVALAVTLTLVQTLLARDPERVPPLLRTLRTSAATADRTLRDLAGGVHPRALREQGLVAALQEATAGLPVPVTVRGGAQRWAEEVEAAAYFCCLEAVQNAVKHAAPTRVRVEVVGDEDEVCFVVEDDGRGFDPAVTARGGGLENIADRVEALGGQSTLTSAPGVGTTVSGRLPADRTAVRGAPA